MTQNIRINITATEPPPTGNNVTLTVGNDTAYGAFSLSAVASAVAQLQEQVRYSNPDIAILKQAGGQLFEALLGGKLFRSYTRATAQSSLKDQGLVLYINSDQPALMTIPWEYLYDPDQEQWLALHPEVALVRGLPLARHEPQPVAGLLRVLVMASEPVVEGLPRLACGSEVANLQAIEATGMIEVIEVEPTYAGLQRALRQHKPHVFHFIGHGHFSEEQNRGYLCFCQPDDLSQVDFIEAERLATLLIGCETLGLAFLNACKGAVTGETTAFAGLTQKLIQQRIPAVLAMQAPIVDDHAIRFSQEFYAALGDGRSVLEAVAEGRKRINEVAYSWGIPTFYLQASQPFTIDPLSASQRADLIWQKSQEVEEPDRRRQLLEGALALVPNHAGAQAGLVRLENEAQAERGYVDALDLINQQEWRAAHQMLEKVEQRQPNYRDTWTLLSQVLGELNGLGLGPSQGASQQPPDPDVYRPICNALLAGRLTPFLGAESNSIGRPSSDRWVQGLYPPGAVDAASILAQHLPTELQREESLLRISQYTLLYEGEEAVYERLHELYEGDHRPTMLHRLLAQLPRALSSKLGENRGYAKRRYILFSTALDDLLERAFQEADQPYHTFAYHPGLLEEDASEAKRFFHYTPERPHADPVPLFQPNSYSGHHEDKHPIIVKLCGCRATPEAERVAGTRVAVTEDHYMNYALRQSPLTLLPIDLLDPIKRNNFLFFGHSLHPWHLRLIWQWLNSAGYRNQSPKWAVGTDLPDIEKRYWHEYNVQLIETPPEAVVAHINQWLGSL